MSGQIEDLEGQLMSIDEISLEKSDMAVDEVV
ncbi:MAG: hypothetical protein JWO57_395, partial [Pseudonocardiales bacterium]|nr:hypothetical protein [Pseudonocardiales bacterium]